MNYFYGKKKGSKEAITHFDAVNQGVIALSFLFTAVQAA
jgi:hypothetical protein